jgi:hypothetical protein
MVLLQGILSVKVALELRERSFSRHQPAYAPVRSASLDSTTFAADEPIAIAARRKHEV